MKKVLLLLICVAGMAIFFGCANNIQSEKTVGATETTQTVEPETAAFWEETEPLSIHIGSTWGSKKTYSITKDAITVSIQDFDGESGVVGIYRLSAEEADQIGELAQSIDMDQKAFSDESITADGLVVTVYMNEKSLIFNYRERSTWTPAQSDDALKFVQYVVSISDQTVSDE